MPAVKLKLPPGSNVVLQPPSLASAHQQLHAPHTTGIIYYAFAAFVVLSLLHTALGRCPSFLSLWARGPGTTPRRNQKSLEDLNISTVSPLGTTETVHHFAALEELNRTPTGSRALTEKELTASVLGMEEQDGHATRSRGVSRSSAASTHRVSSSHSGNGWGRSSKRSSRSPRPRKESNNSPARAYSQSSSDGSNYPARKAKEKEPADGQYVGAAISPDRYPGYDRVIGKNDGTTLPQYTTTAIYAQGGLKETAMFSRPPQPPPFTPPTLSPTIFNFQPGHPNHSLSIPAELELGFIHQPNPDYMDSLDSLDDQSMDVELVADIRKVGPTVLSRRNSYTKTAPRGIPIPKTPEQPDGAFLDHQQQIFSSSSSYPPSSPHALPPPPPPLDACESYERIIYDYDSHDQVQGEIEIQGEIVSALDDAGHGWKRHTRVYGGGVCLACAASGSIHRQGGFYGPRVPLSERR